MLFRSLEVQDLLKSAPGLQTRRNAEDLNFFDLLREGYTIREASKMLKLSRQEMKVLMAHIGE